jgi:SAM-dependent methyltransferase
VWGVEPSPEMAALARERLSTVKVAPAERLPFKNAWFERAVMSLVIHLLDRPRAFTEAARVLRADGRLVIGTFDNAHFERYWLNQFFPSLEAIDRARFPDADGLRDELEAAGFARVEVSRLSQRGWMDRAEAIERVRGRFISTFQLVDDEEFRVGLERMAAELPDESEYALEWLVAVAYR